MNSITPRWAASATLLLATLAAQAQTQPRYTATVLTVPAGATNVAAFSLDANGTARGSANTTTTISTFCYGDSGIDFIDLFPRPCKSLRHTLREATWPASSASRQAPTLGTTNFGTIAAQADGTTFGVSGKFMSLPVQTWDASNIFLIDATSPWGLTTILGDRTGSFIAANKSNVIRKGSKLTTIGLPPATGLKLDFNAQEMEVRGMAANGTVLVNTYAGDVSRRTAVPYLFNGTKFTKLNDSLAPSALMATAINEQGEVAGIKVISSADGSDYYHASPIRWVNGIAVELGGSDLSDFVPAAMNKSGQILLHKRNRRAGQIANEAAIWFNGAFTPILGSGGDGISTPADTTDSKNRIPVAMNSRGDVVGCGAFPFVYRDGTVYDLNRLMTASGVTTPNGNPLYCPSAINDQGVILVNYKLATSTKSMVGFGWLRLTPQL